MDTAIANGRSSSLGAMYSSDEEAEFMSQLLANCSVTNEMNEASSSAIPFAICPSYDFSTSNLEGIYQGSQFSSEMANLYFSNGSSTYIMSNDETNHYIGNPNRIMETSYHNSESFHPWDDNGMDQHQELSNINIENQPGAAIYEKLLQLNRESDHEMAIREPAMENEVMVSENSKKRPCSSVDVLKNQRNVKAKKGQKAVSSGDIEDNDVSTKGQSSSSCCSGDDDSINGSHHDLSRGVSTSILSPKGTKASRGLATDSQSIYAKKRREKINARLRILQNLVPNGTKVDLSTMLEEAIQYVKFLQLQIKLLSSDDMWMFAPIAYNGINIGIDLNS
ncbi:transcription factor bHLH84-like [Pyrus ussuriensis x Pyrus communis]|uniref:Transcription factor bHLH84-like n=1 Tax=Pyrus ussuriensis x Pyrus communis TaxID=2448454 RepID=A0A5N5IBP3_9ROSA|nr:transcription factor bHLH84-like [Pyrus ussuriensis x Pyrus communis]